jgi:hypothetical protein
MAEDDSIVRPTDISREKARTDKFSRGAEDKTAGGMTVPATPPHQGQPNDGRSVAGERRIESPPVRMETGDGQARGRNWNDRGGPEKSSGQPTAPKGKAYAPGTHETAGK